MKEPISITDSLGRVITLQTLDYLTRTRAAKIMGHHASNQEYLVLVVPFFFVKSIDGEYIVLKTEDDLDALIERLGDTGAEAITDAIEVHFQTKGTIGGATC